MLCPAFKELSLERMKKYGIKLYSIYDDLEKLSIQIGKRKEPLCKQIYGFIGDLTEAYDEGKKWEFSKIENKKSL